MDSFEKVIDTLTKIHQQYPELRVMQTIINAIGNNDSYYLGNDKLNDCLNTFYHLTAQKGVLEPELLDSKAFDNNKAFEESIRKIFTELVEKAGRNEE